MKRFIEIILASAIVGAMMVAPSASRGRFYGSWGVEPTPEVKRAWAAYCELSESPSPYRIPRTNQFVRASEAKTIVDSVNGRTLRIVKVEYLQSITDQPELAPVRRTVVIGFDGDTILAMFNAGKGPKEYREAF